MFVVSTVLSSPPSFLCEVASARGMGRSNWIRSVCIEAAARSSTDRDLVNSVNVIDERAREVMVDVIERVALFVSENTKTDRCVEMCVDASLA